MLDWWQFEVVLEVLECGLDLNELDVELPKMGRLPEARIVRNR